MFEPEMIKILEGAFAMGTAGGVINETPFNTPFHEVYLDRFGIAKYPVTNQQYQAFLKANPNQPAPQHWNGCTPPTDRINNPVVNIIWDEAMAYTTWLSQHTELAYRLPTEAEWEKAARGTDSRVYPWGMDFDANAFCSCVPMSQHFRCYTTTSGLPTLCFIRARCIWSILKMECLMARSTTWLLPTILNHFAKFSLPMIIYWPAGSRD